MRITIRTHEAGAISKEAYKTAFVSEPTEYILDCAMWGMFGWELWGDAVGISFHIKVSDEKIIEAVEKFGQLR